MNARPSYLLCMQNFNYYIFTHKSCGILKTEFHPSVSFCGLKPTSSVAGHYHP